MKKGYSRLPSDVKKLKKAAKEAVRPGHRCRRPINRLKDDRPPVHLEIAATGDKRHRPRREAIA